MLRDVTPRDPAAVARMMNAEDDLKRWLEMKLKALQAETFDLINEVGRGYWNSTVKEINRHEKLIHESWMEIQSLKYPKKKKEGQWGRGVSILGRTAPLDLGTYGARTAA